MLTPLLVAATVIVAATTTDLRDLVGLVGADRVRVESLTEPHADPHEHVGLLEPRELAGMDLAGVGIGARLGQALDAHALAAHHGGQVTQIRRGGGDGDRRRHQQRREHAAAAATS